jgi:hypothetical protein
MCLPAVVLGCVYGDNPRKFGRVRAGARLCVASDTPGTTRWPTHRRCDVGGLGRFGRLGLAEPLNTQTSVLRISGREPPCATRHGPRLVTHTHRAGTFHSANNSVWPADVTYCRRLMWQVMDTSHPPDEEPSSSVPDYRVGRYWPAGFCRWPADRWWDRGSGETACLNLDVSI